ncbi:NAD(P)H-dependent oxidoreductase [Streptomyces asiaticus]
MCRSLAAGGARAEVEVLELHRLAVDLAQHSAQGRANLDLREAIAAVVAADGLVVATPVLAASPSAVFDSFFDVLGTGVLSGMPVLLAINSGSPWRPPDLKETMRGAWPASPPNPCPRSSSPVSPARHPLHQVLTRNLAGLRHGILAEGPTHPNRRRDGRTDCDSQRAHRQAGQ